MRTTFPQFDQRAENGAHMQQDAEEFYNTLAECLQAAVRSVGLDFGSMLGFEVEQTMVCRESDVEPPVVSKERANKLICNIQGGPGVEPTSHILEGVKLGLEGAIEKNSSMLGRNAIWTKRQRLASLPRYLCFQFMRFFWKTTPESRDHQGVKCKILKAVTYPDVSKV